MAFFQRSRNTTERNEGSEEGHADRESYRAVGLRFIPAGGENVLIVPSDGDPGLIPAYTAECLARCQSFITLREHAERIGREMDLGAEERDGLLEQLGDCAARGFLKPLSAVIGDWPEAQPGTGAGISTLGTVTKDRPASAKRALESYLGNAERFGRKPDWVVYDDSSAAQVKAEYREAAASIGNVFDAQIFYAGLEEKRAFVNELIASGFSREILEFALFGLEGCGPAYGAGRNGSLLDTAGEAALFFDDDTICRMGRPPEPLEGLELRTGDPTEFWFHADRDSARAGFVPEDLDFIGLHEATLGRRIRDCIGSGGTGTHGLVLDRASDRLIRAFSTGSGRIAASSMGIAGDSSMGSTRYYLSLHGDSRNRLHENPETYRAFMTSRAVVRSPLRTTIGDGSLFMAYAIGLDNRFFLPPFFPVTRNEDGVFASVLAAIDPEAFFSHAPFVIEHDPPEKREQSLESIRNASPGPGIADLVIMLVHSFAATFPVALSVVDRTRALGRYLQTTGRLDPKEFEDFFFPFVSRGKADSIGKMEALLAEYDEKPRAWADDVRSGLEALREALSSRETVLARDLGTGRTAEETLALTQRLIVLYGELLEAWPDIVEATRNLKAKGKRLSIRLKR